MATCSNREVAIFLYLLLKAKENNLLYHKLYEAYLPVLS